MIATAEKIAETVLEEIDKLTMLGAAYDCMSEKAQINFKQKLIDIVIENTK